MNKRNTIVVLAVICVVVVAAVIAPFYYMPLINQKDAQIDNLKGNISSLNAVIDNLKEQVSDLNSQISVQNEQIANLSDVVLSQQYTIDSFNEQRSNQTQVDQQNGATDQSGTIDGTANYNPVNGNSSVSNINNPVIVDMHSGLNGDFQSGTDSIAAGWTYENDSSARAYRAVSNLDANRYSYYIWSNNSCLNAYSSYFEVVSGGYYDVSFSAKTSFPIAETGIGYYIVLQAKNETSVATVQFSTYIRVNTDWTEYGYSWQIPDNCAYTHARLRITMILINNVGNGEGASAWTDNITVSPKVRLIICSEPFLLDYNNLPSTLNVPAQIMNATDKPNLVPSDLTVTLGSQPLQVSSVTFNEATQLQDISVDLPSVQPGKYMLKLFYGGQEALNFKGVNVYNYTGNFSFIQITDVHFNPPQIGYEYQLNETLELLKNADPDFIINTGDMQCSEANYQRFYSILESMNFDIPMFFVCGNHEKESANSLSNAILYMGENKTVCGNEYPFTFDYGQLSFYRIG